MEQQYHFIIQLYSHLLSGLLSPSESLHLFLGLSRLSSLCLTAEGASLRLLVDAEYTYMNPGISAIALAMMRRCNRERAMVGNTVQCYLKASCKSVALVNFVSTEGMFCAIGHFFSLVSFFGLVKKCLEFRLGCENTEPEPESSLAKPH